MAFECGFASQSHFTTAFRRWVGVTPGAFHRGLAGVADWFFMLWPDLPLPA